MSYILIECDISAWNKQNIFKISSEILQRHLCLALLATFFSQYNFNFTKYLQRTARIKVEFWAIMCKMENYSHWKNISWKQLFSNFFSKNVTFTKCDREFPQFPHCAPREKKNRIFLREKAITIRCLLVTIKSDWQIPEG